MKYYLQTIDPAEFLEVNQAITLSGVYTEPMDFSRSNKNVKETLNSLLEVMSESQNILLYSIAPSFRSILEEGRHLQAFSPRLIPVVTADSQGYMTLKAAHTLHIPTACGRIFTLEQAMASMHNQAWVTILDLEKISRFAPTEGLVEDVLNTAGAYSANEDYDPDRVLVVVSDSSQFHMAIQAGAQNICAPKSVFDQMLYSPLTKSESVAARDEWIVTYARMEVLDDDQSSDDEEENLG